MLFIISIWYILPLICTINGGDHPTGHLEPLGRQVPPIGDVPSVNEVPLAEEFFTQYVQPGKPVLFKGAATKMPAFKLWTDEYISSKYGHLMVDVEEGKKENRSNELLNMSFKDFIKVYNEKDVYLVYSLPEIMRDEIHLLKCMLCGGFTTQLQDSVLWFSNGGTKSVLHFDAIDNINCLMSGTKDLFMVDKKNDAYIDIDNLEGSFSKVDVDKVDLYKYKGLRNVPWYRGKMEPGDCLFIPYRWFHQVRSSGSRNMAINIWFGHQLKFDKSDCEQSRYKDKDSAPLSDFYISQKLGGDFKNLLLDEMHNIESLDMKEWFALWKNFLDDQLTDGTWIELMKGIFNIMDTNKDDQVTKDEVIDASLTKAQEEFLEDILGVGDEEDGMPEDDGDSEESPEDDGDFEESPEDDEDSKVLSEVDGDSEGLSEDDGAQNIVHTDL